MGFSQPSAGGDQFDAKDHNGRLIIVYPKSFNAETPTIHGVGPSADVDIVVVDAVDPATGAPLYFQNARLFGNLAKSVSRDLGGQVLGRLGQVPTQRGNPAWVLQPFTDQDAALATPADNAYRAGHFKQTESQTQAPASAATPPAAQQQWQPAQNAAAPQQQWQPTQTAPAQAAWQPGAPAPGAGAPAPAQQQWQTPAPPAAPAPAQQAPPTAQPPADAVDPAVLQRLATFGIFPPPGTPAADILAIAATLPQ